jgi:hypothetical protein
MDKFTKRGTDGSVDVLASAAAYTAALENWIGENEIPANQIETAVNAVLDLYPSQSVPMPALLSAAVANLNGTPAQFGALSKRVHAFVTGQKTAGLLTVAKGKGGGVSRPAAK